MATSRWKKYTLILAAIGAATLAIGNIRVAVPAKFQGLLVAQGRIAHCDFQRLGRHDSKFYVGITLNAPNTPLLRLNAERSERVRYETMCARKPEVRITYHAVKRVFGPVRFWINHVTVG